MSGGIPDSVKAAGLVVVAAAAVGFGIHFSKGQDGPELTQKVTLVDISTGQLFVADTKKRGVVIPEKNPATGAFTLYPAFEENGKWFVKPRYRPRDFKAGQGDAKAVLDSKSGEVKVTSTSPEALVR